MSHKDAPPLTPEQTRFQEWLRDRWARESTTVAFGRDRFGHYFAVSTRIAWEQWQVVNTSPESWRPMEIAPRDGSLLRLLVQFDDHATEDTNGPAPTIGAYANGADEIGWVFAGWCWNHDHFTQGVGTPIGWLPMLGGAA